MAIKKLSLDDFFDEADFTLIGIHTSIEDYRLAYFLNSKLNINLKRKKLDLDFKNNANYSIYEWEDHKQLVVWNLVSNTCKVETTNPILDNDLFTGSGKIIETNYLLPELKKINFLLKINDELLPTNKSLKIINKIQEIPHIITAYQIEVEQLKSKNNLIFN
ncbi:IPExxxVDY family protein [Xanthomarina sp. F2636L]|uniref:IPExxxVDY family protein n=1 Tax=Xanthomarina sp. F2636L TaxID=2996018 RepID=UPI00225E17F6|nr:IPExxxVDY family protein [Xanthomarina sp. F2636L]MCX7551225.1 IPExxxVDY family protein [Xanthomarina sp. F2636L]